MPKGFIELKQKTKIISEVPAVGVNEESDRVEHCHKLFAARENYLKLETRRIGFFCSRQEISL